MSNSTSARTPGRVAKLLAILSVACFWLLPFSPLVALGAVWSTKGTTGRTHVLAVVGAALCIAYTTAMSLIVVRLALQVVV